ncbi:MAG: S8 family serine peptidase [Clostridia bacterium]|nr:S8 family serine peptidase [Clostridia bacterium]
MNFHFSSRSTKTISLLTLVIFLALICSPVKLSSAADSNTGEELVLKLAPNKSISQVVTKYKVTVAETIKELGIYKVKLPRDAKKEDILNSLKSDPLVQHCQPNYKYAASSEAEYEPNDPDYDLQWGLPKIKANQAWDAAREKSTVTLAVLDTGVNTSHPDLAGRFVSGYNTISNSANVSDDNGHGTHVAGIAAAIRNNSKGIAGVSNKISIMPIKVLDSTGSGYTTDICEGIVWAANRGAKIINLSMSAPGKDEFLQSAIDYAYDKGAIIVAAAGNSNTDTAYYPAALNNVIAVSSLDTSGFKAYSSNYGTYIDLTAPGVNIYSTASDGKYGYMSGTSMAASFVSAAAAYLWSLDNTLTAEKVEQTLKDSATDMGYSGKDTYYGYGLINLRKAVQAYAVNPAPPDAPAQNQDAGQNQNNNSSQTQNPVEIPSPAPAIDPNQNTQQTQNTGTTQKKYANIIYYLSEDASVTIQIFDCLGKLIRVIEKDAFKPAGINSCQWDGKDSYGTPVRDGVYTYKIEAVDSAGHWSTPASGTIIVERYNPSITQVNDYPDPINPQKGMTSTISYTLSENANVTIDIYDNNLNPVKNLINTYVFFGTSKAVWDGTNNSGLPVKDGLYRYEINATDSFGKKAEKVTGTITVELTEAKRPPLISNNVENPNPYTPGGIETMAITYILSKDARVNLSIINNSGSTVRVLENSTQKKAGSSSSIWDGKDSTGKTVPAGDYIYRIYAVDSDGMMSNTVEGKIIVTETVFKITLMGDKPDPFLPDGTSYNTIEYAISRQADVKISISDSSGSLIDTIFSGRVTEGTNKALWYGKNSSGKVVPDGKYTYRITATDLSGVTASPVTGDIIVASGNKPLLSSVSDSPDPFIPASGSKSNISYTLSETAVVSIKIQDSKGTLIRTLINSTVSQGNNQAIWDGKDNTGKTVVRGLYIYTIDATAGLSKRHEQQTGTITVTDNTSTLAISNFSADPNPFHPNGSNSTTISYKLSADAKVTTTIIDAAGTVIKVLESNIQKASGISYTEWDAKNSAGKLAAIGKYKCEINATGVSGEQASITGEISVQYSLPTITSVVDLPDPFSPPVAKSLNISFVLSKDAAVVLKVYDLAGNPVRTLINGALKSGANFVLWDGKDSSGNFVRDGGYYSYRIDATDNLGNKAPTFVGVFTIDSVPPGIAMEAPSPNPFVVSGGNSVFTSYTLTESSKVKIEVYDSTNRVIKVLEDNTLKTSSRQNILWNGRDTEGNIVSEGIYRIQVTAVDEAGNNSKPVSVTVTVKHKGPVITWFDDNPDPFGADGKVCSTINYSISKKSKVTIKIYDSSNTLVKTLMDQQITIGGSASWDGTNDSGDIVPSGTYTYKIDAVDEYGNKAEQKTGTVTVDSSAPELSNGSADPNPFIPTE